MGQSSAEGRPANGLSDDAVARFHEQGFLTVDNLIPVDTIQFLRERFELLFRGDFETGVEPDEVNWQYDTGDPLLTRQICNGWKSDETIAEAVLSPQIGRALAQLGGWSGARLIQDNVLWKPPGARALGFHRDNAYSGWFTPTDMLTCWIALDETTADGGTMELVRGSHRWPDAGGVDVPFHAPDDYRAPVRGDEAQIVPVEVPAGGGSFHHGDTWHGSGPNSADRHRRALVIHAAPIEARFDRPRLDEGMGTVYGRYCAAESDALPDEHFPVLWAG